MRIKRVAGAARLGPPRRRPGLDGGLSMDCRICGADGVLPFLDLGKTPLSDGLVRPERAGGPRAPLRPRGRLLPELQDRPHPRGRGPGDPLPRGLPLLLLLLRPPAGPLPRPRTGPRRLPRPGTGQPGGGAGLQRRLPAAELRRGRRAGAGHRPRPQPGAQRQRGRRPLALRVLRPGAGRAAGGRRAPRRRRGAGRRDHRQQRLRPRARPERVRRRHEARCWRRAV